MNKARILVLATLCAAIGVVGLFFALRPPSHPNDKEVRIGVVLPLTGELGNFGKTVLNGVEMAVDDFRKTDPDVKITIITEDSQGKPATAVSALQKLSNVDGVRIVIGSLTSSATLAMAPVANRTKILLVSPTASNPALSKAGPYFYRVWTSDLFDGSVAAEYARKDLKLARIGVIYLNNDYGVGLKDVFTNSFTGLGGAVPFTEGYMDDQADFRDVLTKAGQAHLDGLYLPGHPADIGRILKQGKELGFSATMLSCVAAEDQEFLGIAGSAASGLYFTAPAFDISSSRSEVKAFVDSYQTRYGSMPDTHAVHGYDAAAVVLSGIAKGLRSPEELLEYLDTIESYVGLSGEFRFDNNGDVVTGVAVKRYGKSGQVTIIRIVAP